MYKPASILKRKTFERPHSDFDQNLPDWQQSFQTRSVYSPIRTPPRLRRYIFISRLSKVLLTETRYKKSIFYS
jgi:hypothetical protein